MSAPLSVVELYCGIGGCAAALGGRARVVAAVDQNRHALAVYSSNFSHPVVPRSVESLPETQWRNWEADLWWMSPPCPPHTRRGLQRDLDDPRARSFLAVVERIASVRPRYVALENVPGFVGSRAHQHLRHALDRSGYSVSETQLCPTELGLPNRRQRFYLVAGLQDRGGPGLPGSGGAGLPGSGGAGLPGSGGAGLPGSGGAGLQPCGPLAAWPPRSGPLTRVAECLDPAPSPELWCEPALAERYAGALDVVDPGDPLARTACFTSAYGRSHVRSGSYLLTPSGLRRFSPAEILRLLDFPATYRLPAHLPLRTAWSLVGNSVSARAVRWVLTAVPGLATPCLPT